jgi:hypothetical protein
MASTKIKTTKPAANQIVRLVIPSTLKRLCVQFVWPVNSKIKQSKPFVKFASKGNTKKAKDN